MLNKKFNEYPLFIKTDLLPYEVPIVFSNDNYYSFMIKNHKLFSSVLNNESSAEQSTMPAHFNIYVRKNRDRKMSVPSPCSYVDILKFLKKNESQILSIVSPPETYSIRYPQKRYFKMQKNEKIFRIKNRSIYKENYYKNGMYKRIYEFENSVFFQKMQITNQYFMKVDIKSFFDSIYSHVYKWIHTDENIKLSQEMKRKTILYSEIDAILQRINGRKSNGILIGPEFSRLVSEILLANIDKNLYRKFKKNKIKIKVFRFIDDYYLFLNDKRDEGRVLEIFTKELQKFQLHINDKKITKKEGVFVLNNWYDEVQLSLSLSTNFNNKRAKYIRLISENMEKSSTISSYYSSVLLKTTKKQLFIIRELGKSSGNSFKENQYEIIKRINENFEFELSIEKYDTKKEVMKKIVFKKEKVYSIVMDMIFYINASPTYANTLKLLHMCIDLFVSTPIKQHKIYINTICNAITLNLDTNFINEHTTESSNLLLLFEIINYKLNMVTISKMVDKLILENDYIHLAVVLRYITNTRRQTELKDIFNKIKTKVLLEKEEMQIFTNPLIKNGNKFSLTSEIKEMVITDIFWKIMIFGNIFGNFDVYYRDVKLAYNMMNSYKSYPIESSSFNGTIFLLKFLYKQLLENSSIFVDFERYTIQNLSKLKKLNSEISGKMVLDIGY